MIFPRVKHEVASGDIFRHKAALSLASDGGYGKDAAKALSLFLPEVKLTVTDAPADIEIRRSETLPAFSEGYKLTVRGDGIRIEYSTYAGIRNALSTVSLLASVKDGELVLRGCEIEDEPACSHRGLMLDNARGVMPIERFKSDMILAAKAKMNILHIHLADSKGISIEMDSLPEEYRLPGYYTKAELAELNELARVIGLEIIPEFDMPAHSTRLNELFPALRCDTDLEHPSLWTVCAGSEEAYELYEKIIAEYAQLFPDARYIHIGGDEIEFLDLSEEPRRICHWSECRRCRAKMEKEGLSDRTELNYYFINRINEIVKRYGKRTIIWSDQIDCNKQKGIAPDVFLHFWRVAGRGRGPHDGCSLDKQLDYGYEAINSYYPNTYVDLEDYMSSENLSRWRWDETPDVKEENRRRICGSEACAWEYGNVESYPHYARSLPSAIMLMADKLWCGDKISYTEEIEASLTRSVLGARTPEGFNLFSAIGDILPPRDDRLFYKEKIRIGKDEIDGIINTLEEDLYSEGDLARARTYLAAIKGAKDALDCES